MASCEGILWWHTLGDVFDDMTRLVPWPKSCPIEAAKAAELFGVRWAGVTTARVPTSWFVTAAAHEGVSLMAVRALLCSCTWNMAIMQAARIVQAESVMSFKAQQDCGTGLAMAGPASWLGLADLLCAVAAWACWLGIVQACHGLPK